MLSVIFNTSFYVHLFNRASSHPILKMMIVVVVMVVMVVMVVLIMMEM